MRSSGRGSTASWVASRDAVDLVVKQLGAANMPLAATRNRERSGELGTWRERSVDLPKLTARTLDQFEALIQEINLTLS